MADLPACSKTCVRVVPWFSLWGNFGLAVYKLVVGVLGQSAALVADAMHSFADVIGSTGILVATKVSAKDPDQYFPYGRGKAEFIGAIFVYTVLLFFAGGISLSALDSIINPSQLDSPHIATLLGALVSVMYNYVMYKYATCVGKQNRSPAILADAFENRADAISSVACIGGIFGAMLVHPVCDPIAALVVGLIIFWNCQEQLREAASGLMDTGLPDDDQERIKRAVLNHEGVTDVSFLRTRQTGARFWIDVGIVVPGDYGVEQADAVAAQIRRGLTKTPYCHHVEVFVEPSPEAPRLPGAQPFPESATT
jgi:cation diffusion facilitator family transporter